MPVDPFFGWFFFSPLCAEAGPQPGLGRGNGAISTTTSPGTPSRSRLVANTRTPAKHSSLQRKHEFSATADNVLVGIQHQQQAEAGLD